MPGIHRSSRFALIAAFIAALSLAPLGSPTASQAIGTGDETGVTAETGAEQPEAETGADWPASELPKSEVPRTSPAPAVTSPPPAADPNAPFVIAPAAATRGALVLVDSPCAAMSPDPVFSEFQGSHLSFVLSGASMPGWRHSFDFGYADTPQRSGRLAFRVPGDAQPGNYRVTAQCFSGDAMLVVPGTASFRIDAVPGATPVPAEANGFRLAPNAGRPGSTATLSGGCDTGEGISEPWLDLQLIKNDDPPIPLGVPRVLHVPFSPDALDGLALPFTVAADAIPAPYAARVVCGFGDAVLPVSDVPSLFTVLGRTTTSAPPPTAPPTATPAPPTTTPADDPGELARTGGDAPGGTLAALGGVLLAAGLCLAAGAARTSPQRRHTSVPSRRATRELLR